MKAQKAKVLFNAVVADGASIPHHCPNYDIGNFSIYSVGATTATIKIQVSDQELAPDFGAAASPTNDWSYASTQNIDTTLAVNGSTGYALGADHILHVTLNDAGGHKWIGAIISGWQAGAITVLATPYQISDVG